MGWIEQKRRYWRYKARTKRLPANDRAAVDALERYLLFFGSDADAMQAMLDDLADLFEQSAASATPVRAIVGEDPVEFAGAFPRNYPEGHWLRREQQRLTDAINRVAVENGS